MLLSLEEAVPSSSSYLTVMLGVVGGGSGGGCGGGGGGGGGGLFVGVEVAIVDVFVGDVVHKLHLLLILTDTCYQKGTTLVEWPLTLDSCKNNSNNVSVNICHFLHSW